MDTNRWFWNDSLNNLFLLLIVFNRLKEAELYVVGPYRQEMLFDSILLNDEIRDLDDKVIDCLYVDHSWIFHKVRNDRKHPNGRQTVESNFITTRSSCLGFGICSKYQRCSRPIGWRRIVFDRTGGWFVCRRRLAIICHFQTPLLQTKIRPISKISANLQ